MANSDPIHVAVGVIENTDGDVFISKRHKDLHQGDKWEFPGGKVEVGETVYDALVRELREECNISVQTASPLTVINHDYQDKRVVLDVWRITSFTGEVRQTDGQDWLWVPVYALGAYQFPEANVAIIDLLENPL
ncbi:8-oxo-dGTP diphosphatase MutT [Pseudidiomarina sp. 1APP75-32.1]|uniref:8-oxo-dGTP diphosphatase n=1 Tax=Pseudidiomarina terrestris TaxID=2820060 RepID=A0AAW7R139_9GAMM|nr:MULTISPECIES: 8-oxo-dGTP diphosphatase MutT [unclassified Pseudidiomarina]MDN7124345.1 8-oxo-dGTP diphosphatase MutT [Pseudidiomarina sp. 1APP75-32.1]MDN7126346.1 8-oxo-dGTP diphosphatase MutT [Pseudidiomarina sp. 1APR75-33.1]MDN7129364.1 8-oxo-dGTP diphosphatase MutT [Pseudidiomarina sp. 1APR75-15]MEA3587835.1 8-oxo-dGTP diphosphatase MutT [Pseudidiomarina sp. 1APP75-27a]